MEFELLGLEAAGPTLDLDHRTFAYAGKFVMSQTGKCVAREDDIVGAVAFSADHSDTGTVRLRYVTVREDRQGEQIGPRLLRFTADRLLSEGYERVQIAANNPIAYRACYRAGFVFTGRETGIAELLLEYSPDTPRDDARYRDGLDVFRDRDLPEEHRAILQTETPPAVVDSPVT